MRPIILIWLVAGLVMCSCAGNGGEGELLLLAMEDDIVNLDPFLHDDSITHSVLGNIFEGLVSFDTEMQLQPSLAIGWENPDDLTWRFRLRPGVYFHNGREMKADDVKYSLDRARRGKVGYYLSAVDQVRVLDDMTIEITTLMPTSILLNKLTFISVVPRDSDEPLSIPVGTGPYRFVKYQPNGEMELRGFDRYWRGRPAIKRAVFRAIPDEASRVEALLAGQVHLIRDVERQTAEHYVNHHLVSFVTGPGLGVSLLGINFRQPGPWQDRRVREAIYWAIDPAEAARASGWDALPIDQLVSPYIVGYSPDIKASRPDLKRARKLLAEAGYASGFDLPLEMSRSAANTTGEVLTRQLAQVGIRARPISLDWPELTDRLNRRQTHMFLLGWSCSSGDASDLFDACLHSGKTASYGSVNWSGYSNRKLDALIERSNQVLDNRERIEILKQAMNLAMSDYPMIPIFSRNRIYGASHRIVFHPRQDGRIKIYEIAWRK